MAKIVSYQGTLPKKIDDYVIYELDGQLVIRGISGFNSTALKKKAKYALCRQNAHDFKLLRSTCKAIREVLAPSLMIHNNLDVVNCLTQKMRSLLDFDTVHERGSRCLSTALGIVEVLVF